MTRVHCAHSSLQRGAATHQNQVHPHQGKHQPDAIHTLCRAVLPEHAAPRVGSPTGDSVPAVDTMASPAASGMGAPPAVAGPSPAVPTPISAAAVKPAASPAFTWTGSTTTVPLGASATPTGDTTTVNHGTPAPAMGPTMAAFTDTPAKPTAHGASVTVAASRAAPADAVKPVHVPPRSGAAGEVEATAGARTTRTWPSQSPAPPRLQERQPWGCAQRCGTVQGSSVARWGQPRPSVWKSGNGIHIQCTCVRRPARELDGAWRLQQRNEGYQHGAVPQGAGRVSYRLCITDFVSYMYRRQRREPLSSDAIFVESIHGSLDAVKRGATDLAFIFG